MPCLGPLTLRQQLRLIRSLIAANARAALFETSAAAWRRRAGWASAVVGGFLLVGPAALTHDPMAVDSEPVAAARPCPDASEVVNLLPDGSAPLEIGDKAKAKGPRIWPNQQKAKEKAPRCNPAHAKVFGGYCWLSLEEKPPDCPAGTEAWAGRCLQPISNVAKMPNSIGATP